MRLKLLKVILWILMLNGVFSLGIVAANQKMLWLPEYGQGFLWSWGTAFMESPVNILFVILSIVAFILYIWVIPFIISA